MRWLSPCLAVILVTLVSSAQAQFREPVDWRTFEVPDFGTAFNIQRASSPRPASLKRDLDSGSSALTEALSCPFTLVPMKPARAPKPI
jgi:hypothetical protein